MSYYFTHIIVLLCVHDCIGVACCMLSSHGMACHVMSWHIFQSSTHLPWLYCLTSINIPYLSYLLLYVSVIVVNIVSCYRLLTTIWFCHYSLQSCSCWHTVLYCTVNIYSCVCVSGWRVWFVMFHASYCIIITITMTIVSIYCWFIRVAVVCVIYLQFVLLVLVVLLVCTSCTIYYRPCIFILYCIVLY